MKKICVMLAVVTFLVFLCPAEATFSTALADSDSIFYAVNRSVLSRLVNRNLIPLKVGSEIYGSNYIDFTITSYGFIPTVESGMACFALYLDVSQNPSYDGNLGISDTAFVLASVLSDGHGQNDLLMYTPSSVTANTNGDEQQSWPVNLTPGQKTTMYLNYTIPVSLLNFSFIGTNVLRDASGNVYEQGPVYALNIQRMSTDFLLVNQTSINIEDFYVVPSGTSDWGTEMLYYSGWLQLMPSLYTYIPMIYNTYGYSNTANWMMKIVMANGDTVTIDQVHLGSMYQFELYEDSGKYTYVTK